MKKLLYILLAVSIIFSACKKEEDVGSDVNGCTYSSALNYNPNATADDGSCSYVAGCIDNSALNYNANACYDDGSCLYNAPVYGCMDASANNYNPNATIDDGSCTYTESWFCDGNGWCDPQPFGGGYATQNECMIQCVK